MLRILILLVLLLGSCGSSVERGEGDAFVLIEYQTAVSTIYRLTMVDTGCQYLSHHKSGLVALTDESGYPICLDREQLEALKADVADD